MVSSIVELNKVNIAHENVQVSEGENEKSNIKINRNILREGNNQILLYFK